MNTSRVDQVLQFALLHAGRQDDPSDRELGPIHLIKYVYLADLAFAQRHDGETYTDAPWVFYHYGPWAQEVNARIEPALRAIGAEKRTFESSKFDCDVLRWSLTDDRANARLDSALPAEVVEAVRKGVRKHGSDASSLLRAVYVTPPMLRARPGSRLVFEGVARKAVQTQPEIKLTRKQEKRKEERIEKTRATIAQRYLAKLDKERQMTSDRFPPRYDEVFYDGLAWLDSLAGCPIPEGPVDLVFDDSVWESATRSELRD